MGNILSYIQWRGDLNFEERAFCEVDNLVFSELAYLDFTGIVPENDQSITVRQAAKLYRTHPADTLNAEVLPQLLQAMAASKRYGNVTLSHYVNLLDRSQGLEFSAMLAALGDGTVYVAYRGTSDSLIGWREDFSMSFQRVPAQEAAADYLQQIMTDSAACYRIGGHSKGGNLAVYAAMCCPESQQDQIIEVYSNDGPGFCEEIIDTARYEIIAPKLVRIVPQFSVVGALFASAPPDKIVVSSAEGILQHDGLSWQVEGEHFASCDEPDEKSLFYNQIFKQWIESADLVQRKAFTADLFDAFERTGARSMTELNRIGADELEIIFLSLAHSESHTKIVVTKFIHSVWTNLKSIRIREFLRDKAVLKEFLRLLLGLGFVCLPESVSPCLGFGCGAVMLFWLGRRQLSLLSPNSAATAYRREKFILQMILSCTVAFLVGHTNLMIRFSNVLLGGLLLSKAFGWIKEAFAPNQKAVNLLGNLFLGIVTFMLGLVPLIASDTIIKYYVFSVGCAILLYALGRLMRALYRNGKQNSKSNPSILLFAGKPEQPL